MLKEREFFIDQNPGEQKNGFYSRFNKDYEEFVLACLANGYSKAKIKTILQQLQLPFSEDLLDDFKV